MYGGNGCRNIYEKNSELKAIAMDSVVISYDSAITGGDEGFPCHHALLETNSEIRKNEHCFFLKM